MRGYDKSDISVKALTMGTDLMVSYVPAAKAIFSELTGRSVPVVSIVPLPVREFFLFLLDEIFYGHKRFFVI